MAMSRTFMENKTHSREEKCASQSGREVESITGRTSSAGRCHHMRVAKSILQVRVVIEDSRHCDSGGTERDSDRRGDRNARVNANQNAIADSRASV